MTPGITFDPRDMWARARRIEVYRYAQEKGVTEVVETMPKDLMVARLKAKGIPPPSVPLRNIGVSTARSGDTNPTSHHYTAQPQRPQEATVEVDAAAVLERDWQQQSAPMFDTARATITELRQECKRRGIKMARTDNMASLREKLNAA